MDYASRREIYESIQEIRERPLIAYVTSLRENAQGVMASDAIAEFTRHISRIPDDVTAIDLLVISYGGDPTVSWRVISMLRERFKKVAVLLPYTAYSAATLLALGADEIVMHPFSNLGPVDPQLSYQRSVPGAPDRQETVNFGAEDLRNYLEFVRSDVGISDQEQLARTFERLTADVGSVPLGVAKRSSQLALSLGEKLLGLHMKDQNKVRAIAEALNKSFYHHGYPLGRAEADQIGLPVKTPPDDLASFMWAVWLSFEAEMECNKPYNPMITLMNDAGAAGALAAGPTQVNIPANLPPQMAQQVYQQILGQIPMVQVPPVADTIFSAALESMAGHSHHKTDLQTLAVRKPDLQLSINNLVVDSGWKFAPTGQVNAMEEQEDA